MLKKIILFLCISVSVSLSYDKLQDMRYTMTSEWKSLSKFKVGGAFKTDFETDPFFPLQMQGKLGNSLEVGTKFLILEDATDLDIGGKFYFGGNKYVVLDALFGINHDEGNNFALGVGGRHNTAKNFYTDYELRFAIGDAVVYPDGKFKIAGSLKPTLQFGKSFFTAIELYSSGSVAEIKEDYIIDLIPSIAIKFDQITIGAEYNIAVLLESKNNVDFGTLYVQYGF